MSCCGRKVATTSGSVVSAYVLITVPAKRSDDLADTLLDEFPQFVKEAKAVYGEADVIAKIETSSGGGLAEIRNREAIPTLIAAI